MTTFHSIQLDCPVCGAPVTHQVLMSTNSVGQDTDLRRITAGVSARSIALSACRRCGFTGNRADFAADAGVDDTVRERLGELPPLFDPPGRWERYALITQWRGKSAKQIANCYLNAAWCIRDEGSVDDREPRLRLLAAMFFEEYLETDDGQADPERPALAYLIAENRRRAGGGPVAAEWFDKAIALASADPDLDWLVTLAQQQKTAPQQR